MRKPGRERGDRRAGAAAVGAALWLLSSAAGAAQPIGADFRIRLADHEAAIVLEAALEGAGRRLARPFCQQLLSDFSDAAGRPLWSGLAGLAPDPRLYLEQMVFVDGSETRQCRERTATAVTSPGSRVVWICSRRLLAHAQTDRRAVEIVVIHELLHSLGLGENPPTSDAITVRVAWRCGAS